MAQRKSPDEANEKIERRSLGKAPQIPPFALVRAAVQAVFSEADEPVEHVSPITTRFIPDTFDRSEIREVIIGKEIMLPDGLIIAIQGVPFPKLSSPKK